MSQFGSQTIDNRVSPWSGAVYQDPIGGNTLPNQGVGPYSQNSLNGHIGANWNQGPVLPPANKDIQTDHGPAIDNYGLPIYWQVAQGVWATTVNIGTPALGAALKVAGQPNQVSLLCNPAFSRTWAVGSTMTFVSVNGAQATKTAMNALTGTIVSINAAGDRVIFNMGASVAALDFNGWGAVGTYIPAP